MINKSYKRCITRKMLTCTIVCPNEVFGLCFTFLFNQISQYNDKVAKEAQNIKQSPPKIHQKTYCIISENNTVPQTKQLH